MLCPHHTQLESTLGQIEALRSELRLRADGLGDGQLVRGAGVMSWLAGWAVCCYCHFCGGLRAACCYGHHRTAIAFVVMPRNQLFTPTPLGCLDIQMRRSRRRAGVDVDEEVYIDVKGEAAAVTDPSA